MSLEITSPADLLDVAHFCEGRRMLEWVTMRHMLAIGHSYALRAGGELVAICFICPLKDGCGEACFSATPAARPHMLAICRAIRLTISRSPYRAIVAVITSPSGARIAQAAGFRRQPDNELGEVWGYVRDIKRHFR